jgi:hypothetical protein
MRLLLIPAAAAIILGSGTVSATALTGADRSVLKAAVSDITPAKSTKRRPYYQVRVPRYPNQGWVAPQHRGFQDPGYAYHGNINGCVVDLGYGRWESCNVGR